MAVAVAVSSLAAPGPAVAAAPPENPVQGVSSIDQYVEAIPTSSGPRPTGSRPSGATVIAPEPLSPGLASEVRASGGADADALLEIATSPTYGAPATPKDPDRLGDVSTASDSQPSPLDAVVTPLAEADEPRLLGLLALMGAMTLFAFALAARRQRR